MGPQEQNWGNEKVKVYFLDPLRFEALKAELDAGGEYSEVESRTEKNRDWEQGKTFARWAVRSNGRFQLELYKEDNSLVSYTYKKVDSKSSVASGLTLDESLRKYMGPCPQTWDEGENVTVYFLDPLHFEEFKVEIDAGDTLYQAGSWTDNNRSWAQGETFARWAARGDGTFDLNLCKKNNTTFGYVYKKPPQVGDAEETIWYTNESNKTGARKVTITYLGLEDPGFELDPSRNGMNAGRYKGYYKVEDPADGNSYLYYPTSGDRNPKYSKPLN
jgi:hypothetical protein